MVSVRRTRHTDNGLACCSIHHQAFDRGAITISDDLLIPVSSRVHGGGRFDDLFEALHGAPLPKPALKTAQPRREFLEWHRSEVFRASRGASTSIHVQPFRLSLELLDHRIRPMSEME
jgi:hypothetical protein